MSDSSFIDECIKTWNASKRDKRIAFFCDTFDEWISQITEKKKKIVIELLQNFNYYSHSLVNEQLKLAHNHLIEELDISLDYTIFTHMPRKDGSINSSVSYLVEYNIINSLDRDLVVIDIECIPLNEWINIKNIVIIDDILGSGTTLMKYITKYENRFSGKNIYIVTIHTQEAAKNKVIKFCNNLHLSINFVSYRNQQKAFELGFNDKQKQIIIDESKKFNIPKSNILGFKNSQALVAFYNNTPNNTLGIFCINTPSYKAIFPRKVNVRPAWRDMKEAKYKRKAENYLRKSLNSEE